MAVTEHTVFDTRERKPVIDRTRGSRVGFRKHKLPDGRFQIGDDEGTMSGFGTWGPDEEDKVDAVLAKMNWHREMKEALQQVMNDLINDRQEQALAAIHQYFISKVRESIK